MSHVPHTLYRYVARYCERFELKRPEGKRYVQELTWESDMHLGHNEVREEGTYQAEHANGIPVILTVEVLKLTVEQECVHNYERLCT